MRFCCVVSFFGVGIFIEVVVQLRYLATDMCMSGSCIPASILQLSSSLFGWVMDSSDQSSSHFKGFNLADLTLDFVIIFSYRHRSIHCSCLESFGLMWSYQCCFDFSFFSCKEVDQVSFWDIGYEPSIPIIYLICVCISSLFENSLTEANLRQI